MRRHMYSTAAMRAFPASTTLITISCLHCSSSASCHHQVHLQMVESALTHTHTHSSSYTLAVASEINTHIFGTLPMAIERKCKYIHIYISNNTHLHTYIHTLTQWHRPSVTSLFLTFRLIIIEVKNSLCC